MTLLHPATIDQAAAKIGIYGGAGVGKTLTATLIAIGLSKTYHQNKPICIVDGESAAAFVKDICDLEGVPLMRVPSYSFVDMRDGLKEAEASCCVFIVDHYDGANRELLDSARAALNLQGRRLGFHHRDEILAVWNQWTRQMRESPLHVILNGRLAWEWEDISDDAGDVQSIKVNTKMRGDSGYEPDLLIELDAIRDSLQRDKKTRSRRGSLIHSAVVLKDRFRVLNGRSWQWKDINDYKAGDYQKVYAPFAPHFAKLAINARVVDREGPRASTGLFHAPSGESAFAERTRKVTIATEELHGIMSMIWPGSTNEEKRLRNIVLRTLFGTFSTTQIEGLLPEALEAGVQAMKLFEAEAIAESHNVRLEPAVIALIQKCKDDVSGMARQAQEVAVF